ncbi:fimbrial protein, partial [Escherichia coli]
MIKSTGALLLFAALSAGQAIASDVAFRGNLLDRPCHVSGDSLNKHVVFKTRAS